MACANDRRGSGVFPAFVAVAGAGAEGGAGAVRTEGRESIPRKRRGRTSKTGEGIAVGSEESEAEARTMLGLGGASESRLVTAVREAG